MSVRRLSVRKEARTSVLLVAPSSLSLVETSFLQGGRGSRCALIGMENDPEPLAVQLRPGTHARRGGVSVSEEGGEIKKRAFKLSPPRPRDRNH